MTLPDVNLLVLAHNEDAAHHRKALAWWNEQLSQDVERIGLAWVVILGFLRLITKRALFPKAFTMEEAAREVRRWLAQPMVDVIHPGPRHADLLLGHLTALGATGNLTTDAHLASIAQEHGAMVASADTDFARFKGVRWFNPLDA
jgi:toxin-antitoxin system PIN domain toxin